MNQFANFQGAILKKKARIEEIALILAQPLPKGGSAGHRRTLIEERLHLEQAVSELEREIRRLQAPNAGLLELPDGLRSSADPVGGNPFPVGDPRHRVWEDATQEAEEKWWRLPAESERTPAGPPSAVIASVCERTTKRFDIWAERGFHVVWTDRDLHVYDRWLVDYAEAWLQDFNARKLWHDIVPPTDLLAELRLILTKRVGWWKSEARRHLIELKAESAKKNAPTMKSELEHSKPKRGRPPSKLAASRREVIQRVATQGLKGAAYCEALDKIPLSTSVHWQKNEDCPKKYLDAYNHADRNLRKKWRDRIANEKYLVTRRGPLV